MTGEIVGGWSSVVAAYTLTAAALIAQAVRLWRLARAAAAGRGETGPEAGR